MTNHIIINVSGKYPATFYFRKKFVNVLSSTAQAKLLQTIGNPEPPTRRSGRTTTFGLDSPFEVESKKYLSIRCKGSRLPQKNILELTPHMGMGYNRHPITIDKHGIARSKKSPPDEPQGTMSFEALTTEYQAALTLGEDITDLVLGYGLYTDLRFREEPVGFVVFAQESPGDMRLEDIHFLEAASTGCERLFFLFGQALSQMHFKGLVHLYPHLANWGVLSARVNRSWLPIYNRLSYSECTFWEYQSLLSTIAASMADWRVVIRDLETASKLGEMTPEQRFGYMLHDLGRVISEIYIGHSFISKEAILASRFFQGYFFTDFPIGDYSSLQKIISISDEAQEASEPQLEISLDLPSWVQAQRTSPLEPIFRNLLQRQVPELVGML